MGTKAKGKNQMEKAADKIKTVYRPAPDASDIRKDIKKKMSGGMAIGGGHKNYKMTGMMTAKYGKMAKAKTGMLTEKQKTLPMHLQKAIKA